MKIIKVIEMDGKEIMNSFKKETTYEFSEAVPIINDRIYFIFKTDIISIDIDPSKTKRNKLKKIMRNIESSKSTISHLEVEPIAYLLEKRNNNKTDYEIESIDGRYDSFLEKNKNKLLEEFLKDKS